MRFVPGGRLYTCAASVAGVLLLTVITPALETFTPSRGGKGGTAFQVKCPDGQFLVGIHGRTGSWIDRVATICAPWDPQAGSLGGPGLGVPFGSNGGAPRSVVCPGGAAISGWEIQVTRMDTPRVVEYLALECRTMRPPHDVVRVGRLMYGAKAPPSSAGSFGSTPQWFGCPHGELAIGMHGASGVYVDRLGLICARVPRKVSRLGKKG